MRKQYPEAEGLNKVLGAENSHSGLGKVKI